ncbi:heparan-alpha-glucosaminide N-acetyltransferase domain-containing protein [Zhihengliuella salsuginis]|uniref:Heparan-alpha-glucosaminide N-acetyltransferase catalytic domain-containing protein n=1 Tax=Zhihengliuella salsuginis TaxID=578222 RepID=A0ABQ3GIZ6_9MICC|nr:heparan-alpha-glucosaminide N-acetyltransferase domain-containing protein [Zhihengliuella salsuginis]GHD09782.1 hypothetical protein GCM10008096_22790 [Zhihengliuella salsuginis]
MSARLGRIGALDAARGVAILGMLYAHAAPVLGTSPLPVKALAAATQVTAPLFVVLAGMSIGLMTGGAEPPASGAERRAMRLQQLRRAVALVVIGVLLWWIGSPIAVVIDSIGIVLLLAIPLLFCPRAVIAGVGAAALVLSPLAQGWAASPDVVVFLTGNPVLERLASWLVAGPHYWALLFLPFLAAGLVAARTDLRRSSAPGRLAAAGGIGVLAGAAVGAWGGMSIHPGSTTVAGNLVALGCALLVIAALLQIERLPATAGLVGRWNPLVAAGRMPLTVYSLQIILFEAARPWVDVTDSWLFLGAITAFLLVIAWSWRRWAPFSDGSGPLELLVARVSGRGSTKRVFV